MTKNLTILEPQTGVDAYRISTDAAGMCKEIVVASALIIQGRKYVRVEGWQAIAIAHGCVASSSDVEKVEGGFKAIGTIRRMSDGVVIAQAEGFVGDDEKDNKGNATWGNRPEYARRAMAQTRAISRACRSAFAHVVVMMNAGLSTTPAEEVPSGGFEESHESVPETGSPHTGQMKNPDDPATGPQLNAIEAILTKLVVKDEMSRHERVSKAVGLTRIITSMKELTKSQASEAIRVLGTEQGK